MDDTQKIYLLANEDGVKFVPVKTIDFSPHKMGKEINDLRDNDWAHVHITERTLSFDDKTYNLNSLLNVDITIPTLTYGETKKQADPDFADDDDDKKDDDEDDDDQDEGNKEANWRIQSL